MPANAVAIVLDDEGQRKLECKAHNAVFEIRGEPVERGVVSYYAARALPGAGSTADWVRRMTEDFRRDAEAGRIAADVRLKLRIAGNPSLGLPLGTTGTSAPR